MASTLAAEKAQLVYKPIAGLNEKLTLRAIYVLSGVVFLVVLVLALAKRPQQDLPYFATLLPGVNAALNAICFLLLLGSLAAIRSKNYLLHMRINLAAFVCSALFLVSYVLFHSFGIEVKYPETGFRPVYLLVLVTHIILAAVVLPLVLVSFYRALSGQISRHKKIVRWTFPIWLYVTFTGVLVYILISPYYPWNLDPNFIK